MNIVKHICCVYVWWAILTLGHCNWRCELLAAHGSEQPAAVPAFRCYRLVRVHHLQPDAWRKQRWSRGRQEGPVAISLKKGQQKTIGWLTTVKTFSFSYFYAIRMVVYIDLGSGVRYTLGNAARLQHAPLLTGSYAICTIKRQLYCV